MGLTAPSGVVGVGKRRPHTTKVNAVTHHSLCLHRGVRYVQAAVQQGFHATRILRVSPKQGERTFRSHSSLLNLAGFAPPFSEYPPCVEAGRFSDIEAQRMEEINELLVPPPVRPSNLSFPPANPVHPFGTRPSQNRSVSTNRRSVSASSPAPSPRAQYHQ